MRDRTKNGNSRAIEAKINTWDHVTAKPSAQQGTSKKTPATCRVGGALANPVSDKGLIPNRSKELTQLNSKNNRTPPNNRT